MIASALLMVVVAACSGDDDKTDPDTSILDVSVADRGTIIDGAPDGVKGDGPTSDVVSEPDQALIPSDWKEVISATSSAVLDVFGLDANTAYLAGKGGLIMKWDGKIWSSMTNAEKENLHGIWGNTSKTFIVGDQIDLYWDGTGWTKGGSTYSTYSFRDVWGGSSALIAVGEMGGYLRYRSLASTGSWSSISIYSITKENMHGIWGKGDAVFVVGDNGVVLQCTSSCAAYGSTWKKMTTNTTNHLKAVWGTAANDIFVVGLDGTILHYNGSQWSKMKTNTSTYFYGVWGSGPKDVWAVGHPIFKKDESIFHYDGTSWTKMPPPKTSYLNAVWGSGPKDVWAVGNFNVLHYTGKP